MVGVSAISVRAKTGGRNQLAFLSVKFERRGRVLDPLLWSVPCTAPTQMVEYDFDGSTIQRAFSSQVGAVLEIQETIHEMD